MIPLRNIARIILIGTLLVGASSLVLAQTVTTTGSGNWSSTTPNAPWPGGTIPASTADVIIGNVFTLTVDGDRTCNSIAITTGNPGTVTGTLAGMATESVSTGASHMQNGCKGKLRALLVGDHEGFRHTLTAYVNEQEGVKVVGEVADGDQAAKPGDKVVILSMQGSDLNRRTAWRYAADGSNDKAPMKGSLVRIPNEERKRVSTVSLTA